MAHDLDLRSYRVGSGAMWRVLAALLFMSAASNAADITRQIVDPSERPIIRIGGQFEPSDHKKFIELALQYDDAAVLVLFEDSPGGALDAALQIGKAIRLKEFDTTVAAYSDCASSCAYAWLSGKRRYLETEARVGFHAAYQYDESGNTNSSSQGNALIGAYLAQLSLSTEALLYVTEAGPSEMRWLGVDDANKVGIFALPGELKTKTAAVEPEPEMHKTTPEWQPPTFKKQIYERIPEETSDVKAAPKNGSDSSLPSEPLPKPERVFLARDGVDVLGLDLWHTQTANPGDCYSKCRAALVCRAYTFNTNTQTCYIKQNAVIAYKHIHAISGYEATQKLGLKELPFNVLEGVDYPGFDYASRKESSFRGCLNACHTDERCVAFAYIAPKRTCWLKSGIGESNSKKGVTSGVRSSVEANWLERLERMVKVPPVKSNQPNLRKRYDFNR